MTDDNAKKPQRLEKPVTCERCGERLPTDCEIAELCDLRKRHSRATLANKELGYCVCPKQLWQRKPHLIAAVLAAKYPKMNWKSPTGKNQTASWIIKQLAGNSKKKALSAKERRTLYEFREKGTEILYRWCLDYPGVDIPLILFLDNLLGNPLIKYCRKKPHTPADLDDFMRYVAQHPLLLRALLWSEIAGHPVWPDEDPYGYDPDGRKQDLYNKHPEYQPILDGMIDDCGYDECVATLASYGYSPYECDAFGEELRDEMAWPQDPVEIEKDRKLLEADMDKLRARMIAALKQMVTSSESKFFK